MSPQKALKLSVNPFFNSESYDCEPLVLLIKNCSHVQSDHINWPGGEKRAAFPFQSHIVLSGNVYLDVNQPAKVLHPASVWRVCDFWPSEEETGLKRLGPSECQKLSALLQFGWHHPFSPNLALKSGHPGCYTSSATLNTSWPGPVWCFCDCTDYCIIVGNHNHSTAQYCV